MRFYSSRRQWRSGLLSTIGFAALAPQAFAQAAPPVAAVQEVVVTGSRIPGGASADAAPTTVISQDDILLSKTTSLEDILAHNPSVDFNGGASEASNNGGGGTSIVGLRNLGAQRTLVLIDGMRLISSSGGNVDLNVIPPSMMDHIEVLKDGASSLYGADAIAGVINIITKKAVDGATLETHFGDSEHGDGTSYGVDGDIGLSNDRGSLMIGFDYDHRDPVQQSNRDWATALHATDPNFAGGSAWRSQLDVLQNQNNPNQIWVGGVQRSATDPTAAALAPNLGFVSGLGRVELNAGGPGWGYLTDGLDRKQISVAGRYDVAPSLTLVLDGFFTDADAQESLRPDPLLGTSIATPVFPGFIIPAGLDGNTTGQAITANLTPAQFGPRRLEEDSQTYRVRAGLEGRGPGDLHWDLGYVAQGSTTDNSTRNQANLMHLAELTGQIPCVDVPGGCKNGLPAPAAQVNFFNGPNIFTPAQVSYLTFDNKNTDQAIQRYGYGDVSGTLFQLPGGALKGAGGFEIRDEHFGFTPSLLESEGWDATPSSPTSGGYSVRSVFGELQAPLLRALPLVQRLVFSPSVRYDNYSTFGGRTTYKLALDYVVSRDLRFRAAYGTDIRAPRVAELFNGASVGDLTASGDPCETNPGASAAVAQNKNFGKGVLTAGSTCSRAVASGAAVTNFHDFLDDVPNGQVVGLFGGNADLKPEAARSQTFGAEATPRWAPGLSISADYYSIVVSNTVLIGGVAGNAGADEVLNGCYGPEQSEAFCSLIKRNSSGAIVQIISTNTNFGTAKAQGVDYRTHYDTGEAHLTLPVSGKVALDLQVTQQIKNTQSNPNGAVSNFNGFFDVNNETNQPKWRGVVSLDYVVGAWQAHYDARYYRHTWDFNGGVASGVFGDAIPDLWYHDISASYVFHGIPGTRSSRIIIGIDNLLDQNPPFIGTDSTCKCNTIAGPFDVVGRYFYTRLSADF